MGGALFAETMKSTASLGSSVTCTRSRSRIEIRPVVAMVDHSQVSSPDQYSRPIRTTGNRVTFEVCTRVSASNSSSRVPNPPGRTTNPWEYLTNMVLRAKK